jgi:ATP-dependent RNA helicase SUPV3L1/SUV3
MQNAALRALRPEIRARLRAITDARVPELTLGPDGAINWRGAAVARLAAGRHALRPVVRVLASDLLDRHQEDRLHQRLESWVEETIARVLAPLLRAHRSADDRDLSGPVKGILYQLAESLGAVPRGAVQGLSRELDAAGRKALARAGARLGTETAFLDRIGTTEAVRLRAILWNVWTGLDGVTATARTEEMAGAKAGLARRVDWPDAFYRACGYAPLGARAIACSRAEALAALARKLARQGAFSATRELRRLAGGSVDDLIGILLALGFRTQEGPEGVGFAPGRRGDRPKRKKGAARRRTPASKQPDAASPFAKLRDLKPKPGPNRRGAD